MSRAVVMAALLAAGCSQGPKTFDVTGTVTYKNAPVPAGMVWLDPATTDSSGGAQGYAKIVDGKFTTAEGGRGVAAGQFTVRVELADGKPGAELPMGKPLRSEYQTTVTISADKAALQLDVPPEGK